MKALIDSDIVAYSCSCITDGKNYKLDAPFGTVTGNRKKELNEICDEYNMPHTAIVTYYEPEDIANTCHSMKKMLMNILGELNLTLEDCQLYLSDTKNFRSTVDPEYKANRVSMRVPKNLAEAKEYLIKHWDAKILPNHEADDVLGIIQWGDFIKNDKDPSKCETIICTLDKDLNMIPGWHYNWRTKETYWIEEDDAMRLFYEQLLKGDNVDNIIGIHGIGDKTATKLLKNCKTEKEMFNICINKYVEEHQKLFPTVTDNNQILQEAGDRCIKNAKLLWILREPHMTFGVPK